ncbi:MAG: hypothetical protein HKN45_11360 [Flavobacteriales bacterium]|nr:hypothetical protein [Flavobacteriales bacterium]
MAQIDYYNDNSQWGQYQYAKLDQVVNNYIASRNSDDYDFNSQRHTVIAHSRRIVKEFYYDILQEIKVFEVTLGPTLEIVLPVDYVDYVRISTRDMAGKLTPIAENRSINISRNYLQDHEYNLLFDQDGNILEGSTRRDNQFTNTSKGGETEYEVCYPSAFNRNLSNVYSNGAYTVDKESGLIRFSSSVESKDIVIEYISDGFFIDDGKNEDQTKFKIHKFAESALIDGIYYLSIKNRRNVPANEKQRARKEYYNSKRVAKRRINMSNKVEFLQAMKGSSVWIKS